LLQKQGSSAGTVLGEYKSSQKSVNKDEVNLIKNAVLQLSNEVITFQNDNGDLSKNVGVGETAGVVSTVLRNCAFD
jgi:hypothetical protein